MTAPPISSTIAFPDFDKVDIRVGRIVRADAFPEARKPAYKLTIDFGPGLGTRSSSAQLTVHYTPEQLEGRLVLAVVNFSPRRIGPFMSQVRTLGVADAEGPDAPDTDMPEYRRDAAVEDMALTRHDGYDGGRHALVRNVQDAHLRHRIEQLSREVRGVAGTGRGVGNLAGLGAGERDELLHVLHRQGGVGDQQQGIVHHVGDLREVLQRVVRELLVDEGVHRERSGGSRDGTDAAVHRDRTFFRRIVGRRHCQSGVVSTVNVDRRCALLHEPRPGCGEPSGRRAGPGHVRGQRSGGFSLR